MKCGRHICEVQINLASFVEIKDRSGHRVYEAARKVNMFDKVVTRHVGQYSPEVADRVARGQCTDLTLSGRDFSTKFFTAMRNATCQLKRLELLSISNGKDLGSLKDLFPQSKDAKGVAQTLVSLKIMDVPGLTGALEDLHGLNNLEEIEVKG